MFECLLKMNPLKKKGNFESARNKKDNYLQGRIGVSEIHETIFFNDNAAESLERTTLPISFMKLIYLQEF